MVLKPQIRIASGREYNPDAVPEITAFLRGGVTVRSCFSSLQIAICMTYLTLSYYLDFVSSATGGFGAYPTC